MPISPLVREAAHFQNKKARNETMKSVDFDAQFALVADYINNSVVPVVKDLIAQKVPGSTSPADVNKFFRNIGDGTVEWASIGNNAIDNYSLAFRKLSRCNTGSILAAGANRTFREVTPNNDAEVLVSQANNLPIWQKLRGINMDDRQVTSGKIALATLTNENFQDGVLATQLVDDAVTAEKIANNTLQTDKFLDGAVDENVMGNLFNIFTGSGGPSRNIYLWGNVLPDNFITTRSLFTFANAQFGPNKLNSTHLAPNFKLTANKFILANLFNNNIGYNQFFADQIIASYQIADNSLSADRRLYHGPSQTLSRNINDLIADGAIEPRHLPQSYRTALGL